MKIPEDVNEISQDVFDLGMARIEKRSILTFVSKLYQNEERRYNMNVDKAAEFVPDFALL